MEPTMLLTEHQRSFSVPSEALGSGRRNSFLVQMVHGSFSEGSRLNEEKAIELEDRLKKLATAFTQRTRKTKDQIKQAPTPSSDESESEKSGDLTTNLNAKLDDFLPTPGDSVSSLEITSIPNKYIRTLTKSLNNFKRFFICTYLLDPQSSIYIGWLFIVSFAFLYNAWVIPVRGIFPYQTEENTSIWLKVDTVMDVVYILDIILFKTHLKFVRDGFWIHDFKEATMFYLCTASFKADLISLIPVDIIFALYSTNVPWLRLPRLLKIKTFWELFQLLDSVLSSPHTARIIKTLIYMLYMIHLNASAYYALSTWQGINATDLTYDGAGNAYIRCYYFATKTATSIGKNPKPSNEIEYMFMTVAWLSGVFIFALLIGQIRDIIATATKAQTEYRQVCYTTFNYLHRFDVPHHLQNRVKLWLNYTWEQQKTLNEGKIISQLPHRMQADLALHVHIETLGKVKLFQNCETGFLRDLVVKLRSIIYLPGDYVCRKGEVGKEMYIVKTGRVYVIGGQDGNQVLATLSEGSVFGEIALLAIGGMTKRTADVRAAGFANLFVLSKADLNQAIKDYPMAQESLRRKAKKLIRDNVKKQRRQHRTERNHGEDSASSIVPSTEPSTELDDEEKVIIKTKPDPPRLFSVVLKAVDPNSKTAQFLRYGSRAGSLHNISAEKPILHSYPSSPYLPASPNYLNHTTGNSTIFSDSSDDEIAFNFTTKPPMLNQISGLHNKESTFEESFEDVFFKPSTSYRSSQKDTIYFKSEKPSTSEKTEIDSKPKCVVLRNTKISYSLERNSSQIFESFSDSSSGLGSGNTIRNQFQKQFSMDIQTDSDDD